VFWQPIFIGIRSFPQSLVCDVAWFFLYGNAFSDAIEGTAIHEIIDAAASKIPQSYGSSLVSRLFLLSLSGFGEKRLPNKS
jgi:hypothetical protein